MSIKALPERHITPGGDGGWSADSHAATLSRLKRSFNDLEENEGAQFHAQRRRIEPGESSSEVSHVKLLLQLLQTRTLRTPVVR
jgi:hypothetical protein